MYRPRPNHLSTTMGKGAYGPRPLPPDVSRRSLLYEGADAFLVDLDAAG